MKIALLHLCLPCVSSFLLMGASAPPDAASLLAAQRAGLGDPAALAKLGNVHARGTIVFEGFPAQGKYMQLLARSGAARLEANFEGAPQSLSCTNGKLFWMTGTGGVEIKRGWSAAADVRLFALGRHRDWREVYARAEYVGETQLAGRACHELKLVPKSPSELGIESVPGEDTPAPDTWWLDRDTKELGRVAIYATVSGAGWQRLVIDYSDWRETGGIRFPFQSRMTFGPPDHALVIGMTCESLDIDAKLANDPFQPDEQIFRELARLQSEDAHKAPTFTLGQRKELRTATVRVTCKPDQIQQQLALILPEVMSYLGRERLAPVGPPFARYHEFGERVDLEAGIPVERVIAGNGRVKPSVLPGGQVVSGMHVGPYQELSRTHAALAQWLVDSKLTADGAPWEVYWTDPGLERDPSKWRTEIFQPVSPRTAAGAPASSLGEQAANSGAERTPDVDLRRFEILLGEWIVKGDIEGHVAFEWIADGHFLLQRFELVHAGRKINGIEVIGRERLFGAQAPSPDIKSRAYDNVGNTLDYVWEIDDGTLKIWGGKKGSPFAFEGKFSADGDSLTGGWTWPGGGYEQTMTRVVESKAARRARGE